MLSSLKLMCTTSGPSAALSKSFQTEVSKTLNRWGLRRTNSLLLLGLAPLQKLMTEQKFTPETTLHCRCFWVEEKLEIWDGVRKFFLAKISCNGSPVVCLLSSVSRGGWACIDIKEEYENRGKYNSVHCIFAVWRARSTEEIKISNQTVLNLKTLKA